MTEPETPSFDEHASDMVGNYPRQGELLPPCPRCGRPQFRGGISRVVRCVNPWCALDPTTDDDDDDDDDDDGDDAAESQR
jgi:hypothetical protein